MAATAEQQVHILAMVAVMAERAQQVQVVPVVILEPVVQVLAATKAQQEMDQVAEAVAENSTGTYKTDGMKLVLVEVALDY